jgi:hypothetical protein
MALASLALLAERSQFRRVKKQIGRRGLGLGAGVVMALASLALLAERSQFRGVKKQIGRRQTSMRTEANLRRWAS